MTTWIIWAIMTICYLINKDIQITPFGYAYLAVGITLAAVSDIVRAIRKVR